MRALILGGTSEARALAARVAQRGDVHAVLSLAGRTRAPQPQPIATRIGGFGGIDGLCAYLKSESIERVVDATHPFAAQMSRHAADVCARLAIPLLVLSRAPWEQEAGDRWTEVADMDGAVSALGEAPRRVFLTIGRLGLAAFSRAPQHHYLVRTIDPPDDLARLPQHRLLLGRGPFLPAEEQHLMRKERINVLVTKNSGGPATYAKMIAARNLGLPAVLVSPPKRLDVPVTYDVDAAFRFLAHAETLRGV